MEAITAWHRPHETRITLRNIEELQRSKQQTVEKLTKRRKKETEKTEKTTTTTMCICEIFFPYEKQSFNAKYVNVCQTQVPGF